MILSTVADRLTAFTARGLPYAERKPRCAREQCAKFPRNCFPAARLRLFRDSNIHVRLSFETANRRVKVLLWKRNFAEAGKSILARKCTVIHARNTGNMLIKAIPDITFAAFFFFFLPSYKIIGNWLFSFAKFYL